MAAKKALSTPINTLSRKDLVILIRNNTLDDSVEFVADYDRMETDSPLTGNRKPLQELDLISKKLFHSPQFQNARANAVKTGLNPNFEQRRPKKRKHSILPGSDDIIKRAYMKECERDGYSPSQCEGIRKKVLISLFHNKEYSMDFCE